MTRMINLFGAPGSGKSTRRARLFSDMKIAGISCEELPEVAKDFVWEERTIAIQCQAYIWGKTIRNRRRLTGKVDLIVTDSPTLLCAFYGRQFDPDYAEELNTCIVADFKRQKALNIYLTRDHGYQTAGRMQNEQQAEAADAALRRLLVDNQVDFEQYSSSQGDQILERCLDYAREI